MKVTLMKLTIEISYNTGNSCSDYDTTQRLDMEWSDPAIVQQNINDIYEHHAFTELMENPRLSNKERDTILNNARKRPWYYKVVDNDYNDSCYTILLQKDNGERYQEPCFWVGYFEHFYSAEAVTICEDIFTTPDKEVLKANLLIAEL